MYKAVLGELTMQLTFGIVSRNKKKKSVLIIFITMV